MAECAVGSSVQAPRPMPGGSQESFESLMSMPSGLQKSMSYGLDAISEDDTERYFPPQRDGAHRNSAKGRSDDSEEDMQAALLRWREKNCTGGVPKKSPRPSTFMGIKLMSRGENVSKKMSDGPIQGKNSLRTNSLVCDSEASSLSSGKRLPEKKKGKSKEVDSLKLEKMDNDKDFEFPESEMTSIRKIFNGLSNTNKKMQGAISQSIPNFEEGTLEADEYLFEAEDFSEPKSLQYQAGDNLTTKRQDACQQPKSISYQQPKSITFIKSTFRKNKLKLFVSTSPERKLVRKKSLFTL